MQHLLDITLLEDKPVSLNLQWSSDLVIQLPRVANPSLAFPRHQPIPINVEVECTISSLRHLLERETFLYEGEPQ